MYLTDPLSLCETFLVISFKFLTVHLQFRPGQTICQVCKIKRKKCAIVRIKITHCANKGYLFIYLLRNDLVLCYKYFFPTHLKFINKNSSVCTNSRCQKSERSVGRIDQPNVWNPNKMVRISYTVWNPNCLGMGQLLKAPKSELSDFRHLLYYYYCTVNVRNLNKSSY